MNSLTKENHKNETTTSPAGSIYETDLKQDPEGQKSGYSNNSLAPEVNAIVDIEDDPELPVNTVRAWTVGMIFIILGTGLNTFFGARLPSIYISPFVGQFLAYPATNLLGKILPTRTFNVFGKSFTLNPSTPFNEKEHMLITVLSSVSFPTATAVDIILVTKLPRFFGNEELGSKIGWQILTCLSIQLFGFGLAGINRNFLVYPSSMIWPINLAKISLNKAMHKNSKALANGWKIGSFKFLLIVTVISFLYYFLPGYCFTSLMYFNWPTWISPQNATLATVMGTITGLGFNLIPTFDWSYVTTAGLQPLITPFTYSIQLFVGALVGFFILLGLIFSNTWYSKYLLPNSNVAFDNTGSPYNTSRVMSQGGHFDLDAYLNYSPMYFSAGGNMVFGSYFAVYTAIFLHAVLNHGQEIKKGFLRMFNTGLLQKLKRKVSNSDQDDADKYAETDPHFKIMMKNYKEVPEWWYMIILVVSFVFCCISVEVYETGMPIWGIVFAIVLAFIFIIPTGIVYAVSNMAINLAVLGEIIPGYVFPGNAQANMLFKLLSWVGLVQAQIYVSDLKLAQYVKIPPRTMYFAQMIAATVSTFISIGIINWQMSNISNFCEVDQKDHFTCPYYVTFYTGAQLYGVVGPQRIYGGRGGIYGGLLWGFLAGAILPIIFWLLGKKYSFFQKISVPVCISGAMFFAPYNLSYVWLQVPFGFAFQYYIKRRYFAWWSKYNYVLSVGLTVGVALSAIISFFAFSYPGLVADWPGNTKPNEGCDGIGCPLLELPSKGYFGPGPGEY